MWGENVVTMDEEKAEGLNAFFTSVWNKGQLFLEYPRLEDRDKEENKARNPRRNCCELLLH